jgi:hypothetical protein
MIMQIQDKKRLTWLAGGAVIMLIIAVILGLFLSSGKKDGPKMNTEAPGLVVDIDDAPTFDTKRTLRCFVDGEFVGQLTIADCAKKNGVAAQSLDVGIDESGEMTAAPTASLAPPPVAPITTATVGNDPQPNEVVPAQNTPVAGPVGACLRYAGGEWNRLSDDLSLNACVALLYDGRCERPGSASYGRWGSQTLRLVPKRVEISDDNKNFRSFLEQGEGCSIR